MLLVGVSRESESCFAPPLGAASRCSVLCASVKGSHRQVQHQAQLVGESESGSCFAPPQGAALRCPFLYSLSMARQVVRR